MSYLDNAVRHQIDLLRLEAGESRRLLRILKEADDQIDTLLAKRNIPRYGTKAFNKLVERVQRIRAEAMSAVKTELADDLRRLVDVERTFELRALKSHIISPNDVNLPILRKSVLNTPFTTSPGQMAVFDSWVKSLEASDKKRIGDALTAAARTGQDARQLVVGSRAFPGIVARTHKNLEAVVRTLFVHTSSTVREKLWEVNGGVLAYRWTAMLDRKLCPICFSHHGKFTPAPGRTIPSGLPALTPKGLRPPLHANCRCILVPIFSLSGILDLPTADEWLTTQTTGTQNEVLGVTRATLFRQGKIEAASMTNQTGRLITLDEFLSER